MGENVLQNVVVSDTQIKLASHLLISNCYKQQQQTTTQPQDNVGPGLGCDLWHHLYCGWAPGNETC